MRKTIAAVTAAAVCVGCAAPRANIASTSLSRTPSGMSDDELCRAWVYANDTNQAAYEQAAYAEASQRGMTFTECAKRAANAPVAKDNTARNVLLGLALVAAAVVIAKKGGGGAGYAAPATLDHDWDWDQFYNESFYLVWACRGVQTGRFAEHERCAFKVKVDQRWPSLEAPR